MYRKNAKQLKINKTFDYWLPHSAFRRNHPLVICMLYKIKNGSDRILSLFINLYKSGLVVFYVFFLEGVVCWKLASRQRPVFVKFRLGYSFHANRYFCWLFVHCILLNVDVINCLCEWRYVSEKEMILIYISSISSYKYFSPLDMYEQMKTKYHSPWHILEILPINIERHFSKNCDLL